MMSQMHKNRTIIKLLFLFRYFPLPHSNNLHIFMITIKAGVVDDNDDDGSKDIIESESRNFEYKVIKIF